MSYTLAVPIHLTALHLKQARSVVEAMADFSRLPYTDDQRDLHADTANISETIISRPFQNENLYLQAGVHLHWALPDALTRSIAHPQKLRFPAVPTRWLITRSRNQVVEKQWVVESDYLFPPEARAQCGSIPYPIQGKPQAQPFRYLGRKMPLGAWLNQPAGPQPEYLPELTAVGYGEPSFAAFYPNCHSVFGFHDGDDGGAPPNGQRYDLLGWYRLAEQDYLKQFLQDRKTASPDALLAALKEHVQWTYADTAAQPFPEQMLCYACLTFDPDYQSAAHPDSRRPVRIAVGNTGTEALSAQLAQTIDETYKSTLEDQLEALHLSGQLEHRQLDIGPKFQEGRHAKGFRPVSAGTRWAIRPASPPATRADARTAHTLAQVTLPPDLADLLNKLNRQQQAYDTALHRIESQRKQLFADWYKYMLSAYPPDDSRDDYPDIDEVRYFITERDLLPLQSALRTAGRLVLGHNQAGAVITAAAPDSETDSLAAQLAATLQETISRVDSLNQTPAQAASNAQSKPLAYALRQSSAARYWQPADPVVLISGDAAKATLRHGQDGRLNPDHLLECHLLADDTLHYPPRAEDLASIRAALQRLDPVNTIAFTTQSEQPWNPFLLEWEVELFPLEDGGNLQPGRQTYAEDFIATQYALPESGVDLVGKPGQAKVTRAANIYAGATVLTPHAGKQLRNRLEAWLNEAALRGQKLLAAFYQARGIPSERQTAADLPGQIDDLQQWYAAQPDSILNMPGKAAQDDPTYTVIRAYRALLQQPVLAQALGGVHEALLMHKQTLQLPIADPLGFADYQAFTEMVAQAVQGRNRMAPQPLSDFNPIRTGVLRLLQLRLVDTFGQVKALDCSSVTAANAVTTPGSPHLVALPPRLAQPARLNFRWLAADQGDQEMNDHPATSPICGWLLPNNVDGSVLVYDGQGKHLGTIDQRAAWESAPGLNPPLQPEDIANTYLRRLVTYLLGQGATFIGDFIAALDGALEHIEPENFAQHQGLALLMGRPLAVVRASLGFELQGLPACHQGWHAFRQDMQRPYRETDDFTQVVFPIRLGDYRQLNDGLVGYWIEAEAGYAHDRFYSPQSSAIDSPQIQTHADGPILINQSVAAAPQTVTMLVDPRGKIHATTGILPTKAIEIPPDQYTAALQAMEIIFMASPIITPAYTINLALPAEPGYRWSWLEREGQTLTTITTTEARDGVTMTPMREDALFVRNQEIREGWLKLSPTVDEQPQQPNGDAA